MDVLALYVLRLLSIVLLGYYAFTVVRNRTGSVVVGGVVGFLSVFALILVIPSPEGGRFDL